MVRVNLDKVQNVGQGQNLDHLCTPLIWTGWGHMVTVPNIFSLGLTYMITITITNFLFRCIELHVVSLILQV